MKLCLFFCFKQKTAYEMRISDWSSDVCSSDLAGQPVGTHTLVLDLWGADSQEQRQALRVLARKVRCKLEKDPDAPEFVLTEPRLGYRLVEAGETAAELGRTSCRARGCPYW